MGRVIDKADNCKTNVRTSGCKIFTSSSTATSSELQDNVITVAIHRNVVHAATGHASSRVGQEAASDGRRALNVGIFIDDFDAEQLNQVTSSKVLDGHDQTSSCIGAEGGTSCNSGVGEGVITCSTKQSHITLTVGVVGSGKAGTHVEGDPVGTFTTVHSAGKCATVSDRDAVISKSTVHTEASRTSSDVGRNGDGVSTESTGNHSGGVLSRVRQVESDGVSGTSGRVDSSAVAINSEVKRTGHRTGDENRNRVSSTTTNDVEYTGDEAGNRNEGSGEHISLISKVDQVVCRGVETAVGVEVDGVSAVATCNSDAIEDGAGVEDEVGGIRPLASPQLGVGEENRSVGRNGDLVLALTTVVLKAVTVNAICHGEGVIAFTTTNGALKEDSTTSCIE